MNLSSLKPEHLERYRDIARLLWRHGSLELLRAARDGSLLDGSRPPREEGDSAGPEALASDLEALGPTFVKLGQLLSSRVDLFPPSYIDALGRLQDDVRPLPFQEVAATLRDDLGTTIDEAFESFDESPLASASIGQVHRATLPGGARVAVKVQRPGIRETLVNDLAAFAEIARLVDEHTELGRRYGFRDILEELETVLLQELDYRNEARNLREMSRTLADRERLVVPRPVERLSGARVLTMDFVAGTKVTEIDADTRTSFDGRRLAEELCAAYLEQMLVDGFFHADPHPGNVLLTEDGRLALVDLGMASRLTPSFRRGLLKLLAAIGEGEASRAADLCLRMGARLDDYDRAAFERRVTRLIGRFRGAAIGEASIGRLVFDLGRAAAESGIRPPAELALVGKTMLNLDEVGSSLDPAFRTDEVVRSRLRSITTRELMGNLAPGKALTAAFEVSELARELPGRLNRLLEAMTERELEIRIRALDETSFLRSLHRVGTRITLGLVIAAMIVGAALIMRVDAGPALLGYPALAVILFLAAVAAGLGLAASIFVQDVWNSR